jgi:divalent metal cation (Fe/Co/Zn/Cd) transporter
VALKSSKKVVQIAIAANAAIAISKYIAALISRSPAMLAEAFHSTGDTGNELLLLFAMRRSARTPDELHPSGMERLFIFIRSWSLYSSSAAEEYSRLMRASAGSSTLNCRRIRDGITWC